MVLGHHEKKIAHCLEQVSADKTSHMDVGSALGELVMGLVHVFPMEICCCTLGTDWLSPRWWESQAFHPTRASGQGMSGPRRTLEASTGNEHFVGCRWGGGPTAVTHNPPVSVAYTGEGFSCLYNPLMQVISMRKFGMQLLACCGSIALRAGPANLCKAPE